MEPPPAGQLTNSLLAPYYIDSHTHLDQYNASELDGILARSMDAGVGLMVVAGTTVASSERCVQLAHEYPMLLAGVGVHPMDLTKRLDEEDYASLRRLAEDPRVVTISEVGLDHMEGRPDRAWQEEAFRNQIRIARAVGKPVIFHNRDAGLEPLRILHEERAEDVGIVAHYFQGTADYARACLDQGILLSLAKPLLRLPDLQEIAKSLPLDRIVLETDAFPQTYKKNRQNWTEPKDVLQVAEKLAELQGVSVQAVKDATFDTVTHLLSLLR